MKLITTQALFLCLVLAVATAFGQNSKQNITLVIHGGAGTIRKADLSDEQEKAYEEKLTEALQAGYTILKDGGTSEEAIVAAIIIMEESPLFNAGKGAVFTNQGKNELDASIMNGKTLQAGAVSGVTTVKSPIVLAREIMNNSEHVMLSGKGAEEFAELRNLEIVSPEYFYTERRMKSLERAKAADDSEGSTFDPLLYDKKFGTVGAVALDQYGNLAAATSTGGMTNKKWGRIGDAPIIGAGTYANNNSVAVSCTGHGEYFIRAMVAHDIASLVEYKNMSVKKAGKKVIFDKLLKMGGSGGAIILDRDGNYYMPFNTEGMYRGAIRADGTLEIGIYKE